MQIITMVLIGVFGFVLLVGGVFWFFSKQSGSGKKYPFLLFNGDGSIAKKIDGAVKISADNKNKKEFVFEEYGTVLEIRKPQLTISGVGYRLVGVNNKSELHYLDALSIDEKKYLKTALSPEEKTLVMGGFLENESEFRNPMNKAQAAMIVSMMVLTLIVVVGTIYGVGSLVSNSKDMADIAKANKAVADSLAAAANVQSELVAQLASVAAALTGDTNLTRQVS